MIQAFIEKQFPGNNANRVAWRHEVVRVCTAFAKSELSDRKFVDELVSGEEHKFWCCLSEALVAQRLSDKNFPPRTNRGVGPDFLVWTGRKRYGPLHRLRRQSIPPPAPPAPAAGALRRYTLYGNTRSKLWRGKSERT